MGCCNSRGEIKSWQRVDSKKNTLELFTKGKYISKGTLLKSICETINLKRAILQTIGSLEESQKFLRETNTLDNKVIEAINYPALKVTRYFKDQQPPKANSPFVDELFPPSKQSLYGLLDGNIYYEKNQSRLQYYLRSFKLNSDEIEWIRAKDIFVGGQYSVFTNDISLHDVEQGNLGNCYFLSTIAALAEMKQTIIQLFRTLKVTPNGCYEVILRINGEWNIVILDDYFPCDRKTKLPIFARPNGPELWVMLLEKAWAKINGGYMNINGGECVEVLSTLTPFPCDRYFASEFAEINDLWKLLKRASEYRYIMTCGTKGGKTLISHGLVPNHGFTIISAKEGLVNGEIIKLLHIRNPYGFKEWEGAWSDKSDLWTKEARQVFSNVDDKDDGLFYISLEDFKKYFYTLDICKAMSPMCTKLETIDKEGLNYPNVHELILYKQSKVNISIIKKSYRFHRNIPDDNDLIANIILFSIDEGGQYQYIASTHSNNNDPNLEVNLPAGHYFIFTHVIYKYSKFDKIRKVKLYVTNNNYFDLVKKGLDEDFSILKKVIISKVKDNLAVSGGEVCQTYKNGFENTTYGYHYVYNNKDKDIKINFDNEAINYDILSHEKPKVKLRSKEGDVIIGFRKHYYDEFLFKIVCSRVIEKTNNKLKLIKNPLHLEAIKGEYPINEDNYDFIFKRMSFDINNILVFIDEKLTARNYFLHKYPNDMENLLKIPEIEDGDTKTYLRDTYDFEYHAYFGEWKVKGKILPHGRGIFKFRDGSEYQGQVRNNQFDGIGAFVFPTGARCEITFENGLMHGLGIMITAEGAIEPIEYERGIIISKAITAANSWGLI
jgi:hypothetical protein